MAGSGANTESAASSRIVSVDQFRGYAIAAMILVNFASRFDITPWMLKHHRAGMSYNDTIAPIFIFVVGMGFRLSFMRRVEKHGLRDTRRAAAKRYAFIALLGFAIYQGYLWDALTAIGIAGLLALPLIDKRTGVRIAAAFLWLALFQAIFSLTSYGELMMKHGMNGGPLGPLSWGFLLLMGTVCYDLLASKKVRAVVGGCLAWGVGLSIAGWALRAEWPGLKASWPFSQFCMSAPYPLYSTGLAFLTFLAFYCLCDLCRIQLPHLSVLGKNPLVMYLAHGAVIAVGYLFLRNSTSLPLVALGFLCTYGLCYAFAWWLHTKHIIIKV